MHLNGGKKFTSGFAVKKCARVCLHSLRIHPSVWSNNEERDNWPVRALAFDGRMELWLGLRVMGCVCE